MKCQHLQPNKLNIPIDLSKYLDDIEWVKKKLLETFDVSNEYLLSKPTSIPTQAELEYQRKIYEKYLTRRK